VTGDRVAVVDRADGTHQVTFQPGAGREGVRYVQRSGLDSAGRDRLRVIPLDALPLLASAP
jgi:hypothetical protein